MQDELIMMKSPWIVLYLIVKLPVRNRLHILLRFRILELF